MKFHLNNLKLGEIVAAIVIEKFPGGEFLLDVSGDLIRVANQTAKPINIGARIQLRVVAVKPVQFHLVDRNLQRRRGQFDFSI